MHKSTVKKMDTKLKEAHTLLDKLCAKKRGSECGGWSNVTEDDVHDLYDVIYTILEAKFEGDASNDLPIDYKVIDRTKFEPMHYQPVPYRHKIKDSDIEWQERLLQVLMDNLATATRALDVHMKIAQHTRREAQRKADESKKKALP